jgi:hypothetical protein
MVDQPFDLLCYSDHPIPFVSAKNIIHKSCSFQEFKALIQKNLGIKINLRNPYKLCDFKPTYGLVLSKDLKGYNFWGSIDPDVIMGNFIKFINYDSLTGIDVYSGITSYLSGSFFLMRNNEICNNLFKKSKDWEVVFQSQAYMAFDECGGHFFEALKAGQSIFSLSTPIQSMTEVLLLEEKKQSIKVKWENSILESKSIKPVRIQQKQISFNGTEFLLLHLIYYKTKFYFYIPKHINNKDFYYLNSLGYFNKKPNWINITFSKNIFNAFKTKLLINIKKIC